MPYCPITNDDKAYYINNSSDEKIVADYANISIMQATDIDVFTFWCLLHDAVIHNCNRSQKGREYLKDAWLYSQKLADKKMLRTFFK